MGVDYKVKTIYDATITDITTSQEKWKSILRLAGNLYRYEFDNIMMVYAQRPKSTLVADYDSWKKVDRYVKRGSKGIAIFPSKALKPYMRYVFDISDTGGRKRKLTWEFNDTTVKEYADFLVAKGYMEQYQNDSADEIKKSLKLFTGTNVWTIIKEDFDEKDCDYAGYYTPYVTVVKEKDTSVNPEEFGGRENLYGLVNDETERFLDVNTKYKFGYIGTDIDRVIGDFIETDSNGGSQGKSLYFNSGTDILYTFKESNPNWHDGDDVSNLTLMKEIQFSLMNPDEAKYWYSQNALNGDWDDFMYYDGYFGDYYVRVEFTDGQNKMDGASHYYMTVLSSVEDLDTFEQGKFQIMTQNYSYNEFSKLEDDEFMLEFISDRQAVLTNKQTGTSALVKYYKGYLTEREDMSDSEYYFYDCRIVERHDYTFEGKDYIASDGTIIRFSDGFSRVNIEDITDTGERTVDVCYQGGRSILTAPVQIIDGKTLRIIEESTHTDLLFIWSDDNHFEVKGTGDYVPEIDGLSFYYEENQLYGY